MKKAIKNNLAIIEEFIGGAIPNILYGGIKFKVDYSARDDTAILSFKLGKSEARYSIYGELLIHLDYDHIRMYAAGLLERAIRDLRDSYPGAGMFDIFGSVVLSSFRKSNSSVESEIGETVRRAERNKIKNKNMSDDIARIIELREEYEK